MYLSGKWGSGIAESFVCREMCCVTCAAKGAKLLSIVLGKDCITQVK